MILDPLFINQNLPFMTANSNHAYVSEQALNVHDQYHESSRKAKKMIETKTNNHQAEHFTAKNYRFLDLKMLLCVTDMLER